VIAYFVKKQVFSSEVQAKEWAITFGRRQEMEQLKFTENPYKSTFCPLPEILQPLCLKTGY
jgi:hypothetical protein